MDSRDKKELCKRGGRGKRLKKENTTWLLITWTPVVFPLSRQPNKVIHSRDSNTYVYVST